MGPACAGGVESGPAGDLHGRQDVRKLLLKIPLVQALGCRVTGQFILKPGSYKFSNIKTALHERAESLSLLDGGRRPLTTSSLIDLTFFTAGREESGKQHIPDEGCCGAKGLTGTLCEVLIFHK